MLVWCVEYWKLQSHSKCLYSVPAVQRQYARTRLWFVFWTVGTLISPENSVNFTGTVQKMIPSKEKKKSKLRSKRENEKTNNVADDDDDDRTLVQKKNKQTKMNKIWQIFIELWIDFEGVTSGWLTLIEFWNLV